MVRLRASWVAHQASAELEAYLRQRALHFSNTGNFAIAADYIIRLLNRRPNDPLALLLGELAATRTQQTAFREKCLEAQRRLCVRRNVSSVSELLHDASQRAWLSSVSDLPSSDASLESLAVRETEAISDTQNAIRRMSLRVDPSAPRVELLAPRGAMDGRGLYAVGRRRAGDALMADTPFLLERLSDAFCAHCLGALRGAEAVTRCAKCGLEAYCGAACRDEAMRTYHVCTCAATNPAFAQWEAEMRQQVVCRNGEGEEARAALCCLAVAKLCAMATVQQVHPLALPKLRALRGMADYDAETALSEIGALAVTLADVFRQTHLYMEEIISLFALVQTNEFLLPGGMAVYGGFAMLNHSCEPNCAIVGSGAMRRQLVALRDIRDGEQLMINYNANLTTGVSYEDRLALCQQRHFECFCPKCVRKE